MKQISWFLDFCNLNEINGKVLFSTSPKEHLCSFVPHRRNSYQTCWKSWKNESGYCSATIVRSASATIGVAYRVPVALATVLVSIALQQWSNSEVVLMYLVLLMYLAPGPGTGRGWWYASIQGGFIQTKSSKTPHQSRCRRWRTHVKV